MWCYSCRFIWWWRQDKSSCYLEALQYFILFSINVLNNKKYDRVPCIDKSPNNWLWVLIIYYFSFNNIVHISAHAHTNYILWNFIHQLNSKCFFIYLLFVFHFLFVKCFVLIVKSGMHLFIKMRVTLFLQVDFIRVK